MSDSQEDSQQPVRQEFGDIVSAVAREAVCVLRMFPCSSMTTSDPSKPVPVVPIEFVPGQGPHDRVIRLLSELPNSEVRYDEVGSRFFEHDHGLWPQLVNLSRQPGSTAVALQPIVRDFADWIEQRYFNGGAVSFESHELNHNGKTLDLGPGESDEAPVEPTKRISKSTIRHAAGERLPNGKVQPLPHETFNNSFKKTIPFVREEHHWLHIPPAIPGD